MLKDKEIRERFQSDASAGARALATVLFILTILGGVIIVGVVMLAHGLTGEDKAVLIGAGVGMVLAELIPVCVLYLLADVRDAIWSLASAEPEPEPEDYKAAALRPVPR